MGKPERKPRERRCFSSSYFLGCFGVPRKIHLDKQIVDAGQETQKIKKKNRRTRWFSRPTKSGLKKDEITTKPTEKQNLIVEDDKQTLFRVIRHVTDLEDIKAIEQKTKEKDMNKERDINPDPLSLSGYDTCHEEVTPRVHGEKLDQTKIMESESRPKSSRVRKGSRGGRFDPIIGIFIMMLTLMIMLICGRLCAILCTSTWFYFLPRLKEVAAAAAAVAGKRKRSVGDKVKSGSGPGPGPGHMDLNSEAYKKKVVLEGFLVRQHHVSL